MLGDDARDGRLADVIEPGHFGGGLAARHNAVGDLSRRLLGVSFLRLPPMRPSARARASPAEVRSWIMARSNSAKEPTICAIIRPAGLVVSIASVSDWKPASAASIRSMMSSTSFRERDSRSRLPDDDGVAFAQPVEHRGAVRGDPSDPRRPSLHRCAGSRRQRVPGPVPRSTARHPCSPARTRSASVALSQTAVCGIRSGPTAVRRIGPFTNLFHNGSVWQAVFERDRHLVLIRIATTVAPPSLIGDRSCRVGLC